jgi:uncharacterized protein YgbK (DUF1537 family)
MESMTERRESGKEKRVPFSIPSRRRCATAKQAIRTEEAAFDPVEKAAEGSVRMIAVIADDFSGAAELAGLAHGHGLRSQVWMAAPEPGEALPEADLVAIDTDTRLLSPGQAAEKTRAAAAAIQAAWSPDWIYKKTDSVLRGNIAAELRALRDLAGSDRIWFVPANPSKGRVIRGGRYFIGDTPLDETLFASDPTHPALTAEVRSRLGLGEDPADAAIRIPDVASAADIARLAALADVGDGVAGAADFFAALLRHRVAMRQGMIADPTGYDRNRDTGWRAFVCGSLAAWPERSRTFADRGWPVLILDRSETWEAECRAAIASGAPAVLFAIGEAEGGMPEALCESLAAQVVRVLTAMPPASLMLEGGATAVAVLRGFGATRFRVIGDVGVGAPWLEALDRRLPILCVKPGSYPWPEAAFPA